MKCPNCGSQDLTLVGLVMPVSRCNGCGGLVVEMEDGIGYVGHPTQPEIDDRASAQRMRTAMAWNRLA